MLQYEMRYTFEVNKTQRGCCRQKTAVSFLRRRQVSCDFNPVTCQLTVYLSVNVNERNTGKVAHGQFDDTEWELIK